MNDRRDLIIWAAGFLDGEGCISISRSKKSKPVYYYSIQVTAFQNVRAPLEILHILFGGAIRSRDKGWWWQIGSTAMLAALEEMMPFFVVKQAQAKIAIAFQGRKVKKGGKYPDPVAARELDHQDFESVRDLKLVIGG